MEGDTSARFSHRDTPNESIRQYVEEHGGKRPIQRLLVANNGIAAVKCIRSMRRWSYETFGNERALEFVAMATPEDVQANAEYIRLADQFVPVPGGTNNHNYANVELIADIAERNECDAVWAGWGHASENPRLPLRLAETGIAFLGPDASAMRALGDKISATLLAQSANVPVINWSGDGLHLQYNRREGGVDEGIYRRACVASADEARAAADRIGYPVMIKASEGGGGKGIRLCHRPEEVRDAFRQVSGEVPGSPIFIMKMVDQARHLEVQIVADEYGEAIALYGRDCSVQRRHQKIIEEGPVVATPASVWKELEDGAVRLAKMVGYQGAGTVEYLYDGRFYFLELNPRLQVEHPVTEWITGVNLPAIQLQIAMGIPLHRIPSIQALYGNKMNLQLERDRPNPPNGHVIACRVTAENPEEGFQPTSGSIQELSFRNTPNVWGYFSVGAWGGVHEYADSQFGHLFAWGPDRETARRNMVLALKELSIRGDIRTTIEYLITLLELESYRENRIHTRWLDNLIASNVKPERPASHIAVVLGAVHQAYRTMRERRQSFMESLSRGQVPQRTDRSFIEFQVELIYDDLKYVLLVRQAGPSAFHISLAHRPQERIRVELRPLLDSGLLIMCDGRSFITYANEDSTGMRLTIDGRTCLFPNERDPTRITAQVSGRLVRYLVTNEEHVDQGQAIAELEVMKMYLSVQAPEAGIIHLLKPAGAVLELGEVFAQLDLDDPSKVRRVMQFEGEFPSMLPPQRPGKKPHQRFEDAKKQIEALLDGYDVDMEPLETLLHLARAEPAVPAGELQEALSFLAGRIPSTLHASLLGAVLEMHALPRDNHDRVEQLFHEMKQTITDVSEGLVQAADREALEVTLRPLTTILDRYLRGGLRGHYERLLVSLMQRYVNTEKLFAQSRRLDDVLFDLREMHRDHLEIVGEIALSHAQLTRKNQLMLALLEHISRDASLLRSVAIRQCLHEVAAFIHPDYSQLALRARLLLASSRRRALPERRERLEKQIERAIQVSNEEHRYRLLNAVVESQESILDALVSLTLDANVTVAVRKAALQCQVLRAYKAYHVYDLMVETDEEYGFLRALWRFQYRSSLNSLNSFSGMRSIPAALAAASAPLARRQLRSYDSADNLQTWGFRVGMLAVFESLQTMLRGFDRVLNVFRAETGGDAPSSPSAARNTSPESTVESTAEGIGVNVLTIALPWSGSEVIPFAESLGFEELEHSHWSGNTSDSELVVALLTRFCRLSSERKQAMRAAGIKMVTFLVAPGELCRHASNWAMPRESTYPGFYTFRASLDYGEDPIYRHIDPPAAFQLELNRLTNFRITRFEHPNRSIHVFYAEDRTNKGDARFFVRAFVRQADVYASPSDTAAVSIPEAERTFVACLDALETARCDRRFRRTDFNHLFLHLIPRVPIDVDDVEAICTRIFHRFSSRCWRLRVFMVEIKVHVEKMGPKPLRFILFNPTGHSLRVEGYVEHGDRLLSLDPSDPGHLHGTPVDEPYQVLNRIQRRRVVAQTLETTYVYDYQELFTKALHEQWRRYSQERLLGGFRRHKIPLKLLTCTELILKTEDDDDSDLVETNRPPGENEIGMVAWRYTFFTPEYPHGRDAIVIANDITFLSGSFGPREDRLFSKASKLARSLGIPRIYIAANSGARIGLADELRNAFQVAWIDAQDPSRGFEYLYLDAADKIKYEDELGIVRTRDMGDGRYALVDIFGAEDGIGVENLMGSATIAAETSAAYHDCFTITYVAARCVGIGAYLVRLGQRVIQRDHNAPIILTGYSALNKLLGREVYTSHEQLGGTKIMYPNGVTHLRVPNDYEGVRAILGWLAFVPRTQGERPPMTDSIDTVGREVDYDPRSVNEDVRYAIEGKWMGPIAVDSSPNGAVSAVAAAAAPTGAIHTVAGSSTAHPDNGVAETRQRSHSRSGSLIAAAAAAAASATTSNALGKPPNRHRRSASGDTSTTSPVGVGTAPLGATEAKAMSNTSRADDDGKLVGEATSTQKSNSMTLAAGSPADAPTSSRIGQSPLGTLSTIAWNNLDTAAGEQTGSPPHSPELSMYSPYEAGSPPLPFPSSNDSFVSKDASGLRVGSPLLHASDTMYANNSKGSAVANLAATPRGSLLSNMATGNHNSNSNSNSNNSSLMGTSFNNASASNANILSNSNASLAPYAANTMMADNQGYVFLAGLFDRHSFRETLAGWAKTVVVGRARLGGIPVGVIAAQTVTTEKVVPPDPAAPDSRELREQQAGQVWYPDSSFKTAQSIRDFDREGLPLFILANWRGFSGGARDMFQEVLKFGSEIVDALRVYSKPVFVYIPPGGELRGGAWVVLDTAINPRFIEMYADEGARGGVLEPAGTVDIKFRTRDLVKTMQRLLRFTDASPESDAAGPVHPPGACTGVVLPPAAADRDHGRSSGSLVTSSPENRLNGYEGDPHLPQEQALIPIFRQIAMAFADLHDTPGRMQLKGAIRRIVPWRTSRTFFYWRLRRRLAEEELYSRVLLADPELTPADVDALLRKWARAHDPALEGDVYDHDDPSVVQWLEDELDSQLERRLHKLREARATRQAVALATEVPEALLTAVQRTLIQMDEDSRAEWLRTLSARLESASANLDEMTAAETDVDSATRRLSGRGLLRRILG
jgi:acetyl-CoA carboxylase/biotin carboxylase 1